jgi:hypothetical protein
MKKVTIMMSMLLSVGIFCSCSKEDNDEKVINSSFGVLYAAEYFAPSFSLGDINVLFIQDENGKVDTCGLYQPYCGTKGPITTTGVDNTTFEDYPMVFSTAMWYSHNFNELQLGIENKENKKIEDLEVGDSFSTSPFDPNNKIFIKVWWEDYLITDIPYQNMGGALGGRIEVVDQKTLYDVIDYITLSFQDLEFYAYDKDNNKHNYVINGLVEFEIINNGIYRTPNDSDIVESMRMPSDELDLFMMDALNGGESQGRRTFFSEGAEQQECLIINSEEEFREAYKGDKELPKSGINFEYCSLVIGRTYGENSGVSLGSFEITDNDDTYQVNVTLNKSVNPKYSYTDAPKDLYYWNIYPKMEKKPVVFNRIHQDVSIDPINDAYAHICSTRWILDLYQDADGVSHRVGEGYYLGDKRYYIEFKEDGSFSGRINDMNDFSGSYTLPFVGKRAYYEDIEHGVINLSDWKVTDIEDDDPVSQQFMRISEVTQFKPVWPYCLTLYVSSKEFFMFRAAQ